MKKVFICISFILCCFLLSCNRMPDIKYEGFKPSDNIINLSNLDKMNLKKILEKNYENVIIKSEKIIYDESYFNYEIDICIMKNNEIHKEFTKIFNYNSENEKRFTIDKAKFIEIYLDNINEYFESQKLIINSIDIELIQYIIKKEEIIFIIPKLITNNKEERIVLPNKGITKVYSKEEDTKKIALTFDDGPSSKTNEILQVLDKQKIKATFFILGKNIDKYPNELKNINVQNHEIGNHGYSHSNMALLQDEEILEEIKKTQTLIFNIINFYPRIFRFPYGSYKNQSLEIIDFPIIMWNNDSMDWLYSDEDIIKNIMKDVKDGGIVLFHDAEYFKRNILEEIIERLIYEEYSFVTISELLNFNLEENIHNGKLYYNNKNFYN